MNLTSIAAVIAFVAGGTLSWQLQGHRITKMELEYATRNIAQQRENHAAKERNLEATVSAQNEAARLNTVLSRRSRDNAVELDGLRQSADAVVSASSENLDACIKSTATFRGLWNSCSIDLVRLADQADRHVIDIKTLRAAWPN